MTDNRHHVASVACTALAAAAVDVDSYNLELERTTEGFVGDPRQPAGVSRPLGKLAQSRT